MAKQLSLQRDTDAANKTKTGGAKPAPPSATATDTKKLVAAVLLIVVAIALLGTMALKTHSANGHNEPDLSSTSVRKMGPNGVTSKP